MLRVNRPDQAPVLRVIPSSLIDEAVKVSRDCARLRFGCNRGEAAFLRQVLSCHPPRQFAPFLRGQGAHDADRLVIRRHDRARHWNAKPIASRLNQRE